MHMTQTKNGSILLSSIQGNNKIYSPYEIEDAIRLIGVQDKYRNNKKETYYNTVCAFDIETTSTYQKSVQTSELEKVAFMYEWSFSLNGAIIIGRTWEEFLYVIKVLIDWYELCEDVRLVIYVHNLSYEFQFIKHLFNWQKVFALKKRKVVKALTENGIEFRCSYILSGYSLAKLAEQLVTFKIEKLKGDLNYNLVRHSKTPLTKKELGYCINDVLIVTAYIQEMLEQREYIHNIPLTKTGFVREYSRKYCLYGGLGKRDDRVFKKYRELMKNLTLTPKEYELLKRAFSGGFTHASPFYSGYVMEHVGSFDLKSSYPAQMIKEKFPMTRPERTIVKSEEQLQRFLKAYCCMFELELWNVKPKIHFENYISLSHCRQVKNAVTNNGRVVSAEHLLITVTEQDYYLIEQFYEWEAKNIFDFYKFKKAYLPRNFVISILDLFEKKTTLKGVKGKEKEYLRSKEDLNSNFGMTVTDIVRPDIIYDEDEGWITQRPKIEDAINSTNSSVRRFLYYPWGVWITAYARRALFEGIIEFGEDYIYSDTDSVKGINPENHLQFIEEYNKRVTEQLRQAMEFHKIPFERTHPKNPKGEPQFLGTWEYEGIYDEFKTLGAKRYMVHKKNALEVKDINTGEIRKYNYSLTVSGVNKEFAIPFLLNKYGEKGIFKAFDNELIIPKEHTGKMTHTYIDYPMSGTIKDYKGNNGTYSEKSGVHLEQADYSLSISEEYINFLFNIQEELK